MRGIRGFPSPGGHTAYGPMVGYRLGKLEERGILHGDWLDCGCAQGYYAAALAERGASTVVGVDAIERLVAYADEQPHPPTVTFQVASAEHLPFADDSFDGVLMNEVLEHVADEEATLRELARVLRPGGHLALFSPNRWFPFEGHGARLFRQRVVINQPVPLMSWLPGGSRSGSLTRAITGLESCAGSSPTQASRSSNPTGRFRSSSSIRGSRRR